MRALLDFAHDRRGAAVNRFANSAAVIAILAVALASVLNRATKDEHSPLVRWALRDGFAGPKGDAGQQRIRDARFGDTDATPTGSIARVVLDPCTGNQK
jgi:hypothetical protein